MKKKSVVIAAVSLLAILVAVLDSRLIDEPAGRFKPGRQAVAPDPAAPAVPATAANPSQKPEPAAQRTAASAPSPTASQPSPTAAAASIADQKQQELLEALDAYRNQPDADAIRSLVSFLDHANLIVAAEAIHVLGYIATRSNMRGDVLQILQERAVDPTYPMRDQALFMAATIGKDEVLPVVAGYVEATSNDPEDEYDAASRALAAIRSPACLPLLDRLLSQASAPTIRKNCFDTLASIGTPEARVLLEKNLVDIRDAEQTAAVTALARFDDPAAADFLSDAVVMDQLPEAALETLAVSKSAPAVFGRLLKSDAASETQKIHWLDVLAQQSVEGDDRLRADMTALMAVVVDTDASVEIQSRALKVIGELGDPDAPLLIEPYLKSATPEIRQSAFANFVIYADPINYTVLFDFLWDENQNMRRTAMTALEPFVLPEDIELLEKAAQHPDEFVSSRAKSLLKQFNS